MSNPISSSSAAAPVAAYSQAVEAGDLVFVSGQIPLNPENGELVAETIEAATAQSLRGAGARERHGRGDGHGSHDLD